VTASPHLANLPNPAAYVETWRKAYAITDSGGTVRLSWAGPDLNSVTARENFRRALDRRINQRGDLHQTGRNYDADQRWRFYRDQQAIQKKLAKRVRIYQFETRVCRERFAHLLSAWEG
jgi:hypothetical protein